MMTDPHTDSGQEGLVQALLTILPKYSRWLDKDDAEHIAAELSATLQARPTIAAIPDGLVELADEIEARHLTGAVRASDDIAVRIVSSLRQAADTIAALQAADRQGREMVLEEAINEALLCADGYRTNPCWAAAEHIAEPLRAALKDQSHDQG